VDFDRPQIARSILSRCLPEEVEDELARPGSGLDPGTVEALFQGTIARGTADWVVHPQDFFVLCKATLIGNPHHHPPLRPLTRELLADLDGAGIPFEHGVVKAAFSAGGKGLRGLSGGISRRDAEQLIAEIERREQEDPGNETQRLMLWQERYGADTFDRLRIDGFIPAGTEESDPIYYEIRLMWLALPRPNGAPHEVDLTLLTAMVRWSRAGCPANAGWQKTPFTGTHGVLVDHALIL
jgi:hypothetical protein